MCYSPPALDQLFLRLPPQLLLHFAICSQHRTGWNTEAILVYPTHPRHYHQPPSVPPPFSLLDYLVQNLTSQQYNRLFWVGNRYPILFLSHPDFSCPIRSLFCQQCDLPLFTNNSSRHYPNSHSLVCSYQHSLNISSYYQFRSKQTPPLSSKANPFLPS